MKKITIKVLTSASLDEVRGLMLTVSATFPDADIDLVVSDDPALSVVVVAGKPVDHTEKAKIPTRGEYDISKAMGYETGRRNGD